MEITFTCPEEVAPTVNVFQDLMAIIPEETAKYGVIVKNNCEIGCGTRTYNLATIVLKNEETMTGWTSEFEPNSLEVGAYGTATATLKLTAPSNVSPDIYTVVVSATDKDNGDAVGSTEIFAFVECKRENPVLSISSSLSSARETISPGDKVTYWISVNDPEVPGCVARNYIVRAILPSGWTANPTQTMLAVEAGNYGTVQFEVECPKDADSGDYQIAFIASDQDNPFIEGKSETKVTVQKEPATVTVEKLEIYSNSLRKNGLVLYKGEETTVTVRALASSGVSVSGVEVKSEVKAKNLEKIKIDPATSLSDADGQAVFTVKGEEKGRCILFFKAQSLKKKMPVKIID